MPMFISDNSECFTVRRAGQPRPQMLLLMMAVLMMAVLEDISL